jgi:hypothetical protein
MIAVALRMSWLGYLMRQAGAAVALAMTVWLALTPAAAEKFFTPVYVKQTTAACRDLNSLQYRDSLISDQRTEALQGQNTLSTFTGDCTNAVQGEWMFFDGYNGRYVCLRPRPGADCLWLRREAVGEIVEVFPGRKLEQGNKGVACPNWSQVVQKSLATEKDIMAKWRAHEGPSNAGTDLVKNLLTGALGVVTGGPTSGQVGHANACVMYFATAQEKGRRLFAYSLCPSVADPARQQYDRAEYNATIKEVALSCLGN